MAYQDSAQFEHLFWNQVLGDHARFIKTSLYPSQKDEIQEANGWIERFDSYVLGIRNKEVADFKNFSQAVKQKVEEFRQFKLSILKKQLLGQIGIHLSQTFINHMVNELEEFQRVLKYLILGEEPPVFHELHHHMLWLVDAGGHAGAINDRLDGVEKRLKEKSETFTKHFEQFYLKAVELTGYLRTNMHTFPALKRFNHNVEVEMELFKTFLSELEEMELNEQVLGTLSGLMADHMYREECYYLFKLAESTNKELPTCNPTSPRSEDKY
ncbi:DUF2935 domain-containing protein [Halobacillus salinus]|uniref:DUF2935 domain-containing protein n=1 Tax=Halobacillus salinus TaxID=192814 RepID=UPI0009A6CA96|nr:DUF2935 domain-containing protein [Halobacillus salinus]